MNYEEAKTTALDLMKEYPEQVKVMNYAHNNEEFVALAYSPLTENEKKIVNNGGFRWDMVIDSKSIEYRQYYLDIRRRPVKASPRSIPVSKVTTDQLSDFLQMQLFTVAHREDPRVFP